MPEVWNDPERAQALGKERSSLELVVNTICNMDSNLGEAVDLLEMAADEDDQETVDAVVADLDELEAQLAKLEFRRMFSNEMDPNNAYLDIQSGSGGTETQDWAEMLLRMYLRWGEAHGFKTELVEASDDDKGKRQPTAKRSAKPFSSMPQSGWCLCG